MRSQTLDVRAVRRARIVLLAADGRGNREIARELGIGRIQAGCWRDRFAQGGLAAIEGDLPRSGRKTRVDTAQIVRITTQTQREGTMLLPHAHAGRQTGHLGYHGTEGVARPWSQAPPGQNLQGVA